MSYVVHVWERPLPTTLQEALLIQQRLARLAADPHPKFATLAERLTARHPDLGDDDDPGVWTDGPPVSPARGLMMSLGVQSHALDLVLPFVVQQAGELGLVVLDEQAGAVYLPDGQALTIRGRTRTVIAAPPTATLPTAPPTRAEVRQTLRRALEPLLLGAGFTPLQGDHDFGITLPSARFEVQVWPETCHDGFDVTVSVLLLLPGSRVDPLLQQLCPGTLETTLHLGVLASEAGLSWDGSRGGTGMLTFVDGREAVERLAAQWQRLFERAVLPLMRRCATPEGLERALNGPTALFGSRPFCLALAAAQGRTDLEDLARRHCERLVPAWHERFASLLGLLRSLPQADPGPPLASGALTQAVDVMAAVLPRLLAGRPLRPMGSDGVLLPAEQQPVIQPLVADLNGLFVVPEGAQLPHLLHGQLPALGATRQSLQQQATANLQRMVDAGLQRLARGPLTVLQTADARFSASLLWLDDLWDVTLAPETPGGALVAAPRPDLLAFCDVAATDGLSALRAWVAPLAAESPVTSSRTVLYRQDRRWTALPPPRDSAG